MNFRIYFKDTVVLTVNGKKKTFQKGKLYGFQDIDAKEVKAIKKLVMKTNTMIFTETDDMMGCFEVVIKNKSVKDKIVDNLISMNKGKKNKNYKKVEKEPETEQDEDVMGDSTADTTESEIENPAE